MRKPADYASDDVEQLCRHGDNALAIGLGRSDTSSAMTTDRMAIPAGVTGST